jgi:hypothetical protein
MVMINFSFVTQAFQLDRNLERLRYGHGGTPRRVWSPVYYQAGQFDYL